MTSEEPRMFLYLGVMPELATLLDQLIETTPPADDPTGRSTFDALETLRLIRNTVDHQIVTHAAQLDELGVAQKAGSTTKKLLIESGHAPAAALRTMRSVDALPALPALTRHAADGRLTGEVVDAVVALQGPHPDAEDLVLQAVRVLVEQGLVHPFAVSPTPTVGQGHRAEGHHRLRGP